ncbi:uncharacterized protein LOC122857683 [Aphidius gifuensis]|uniref:uncharacterized protein LOC122857683 n=1 Tax=Aphidius gifuensis TaxID=684658 RepID=UPI001CDB60DB|nr:uncharacterized protein LOC122857683 [Aphidius gifuensis]
MVPRPSVILREYRGNLMRERESVERKITRRRNKKDELLKRNVATGLNSSPGRRYRINEEIIDLHIISEQLDMDIRNATIVIERMLERETGAARVLPDVPCPLDDPIHDSDGEGP